MGSYSVYSIVNSRIQSWFGLLQQHPARGYYLVLLCWLGSQYVSTSLLREVPRIYEEYLRSRALPAHGLKIHVNQHWYTLRKVQVPQAIGTMFSIFKHKNLHGCRKEIKTLKIRLAVCRAGRQILGGKSDLDLTTATARQCATRDLVSQTTH